MHHATTDQVSLEIARRVSERIRQRPELIAVARTNLARWSDRNASAPALLRCYAEWHEILALPVETVCKMLCAETDEGQRLRQNSPFAGILPPSEVWAIKARFRHAATPD
jgi:hypothetical protein